MKSVLREMKERFHEIEESYCDSCDRPMDKCVCDEEEIDEQNVTGAVAGFNTPAAFAKPGKWRGKEARYESINVKPTFDWKTTEHQAPESDEEIFNDKFPFSPDASYWWQSDQEFPVKYYPDGEGTNNIEDNTTQIGNLPQHGVRKQISALKVEDVMERKYEELLEGYRSFATADKDVSPDKKVNHTIQEIAKKLQEIDELVKHNARLKTESGVAASSYGARTKKALSTISERLVKISERVRALGE
jgi:hypothetical protein